MPTGGLRKRLGTRNTIPYKYIHIREITYLNLVRLTDHLNSELTRKELNKYRKARRGGRGKRGGKRNLGLSRCDVVEMLVNATLEAHGLDPARMGPAK